MRPHANSEKETLDIVQRSGPRGEGRRQAFRAGGTARAKPHLGQSFLQAERHHAQGHRALPVSDRISGWFFLLYDVKAGLCDALGEDGTRISG